MRRLRPLCKTCVYWLPDGSAREPSAGHCHRFPPGVVVNPQSGVVVQKFPTTDHHHWCGEWSDDETRLLEAARRSVLGQAAVAG